MNNERMNALLTYLDGLAKLTANEYRCNTEIGECIGMIREELASKPIVINVETNGAMPSLSEYDELMVKGRKRNV